MRTFSLSHTTRVFPKHPYEKIKNDILGNEYVVSLVFVGKKRAQALNATHRKKTYVPNILAFPLDKNNGEIVMCPTIAKIEAPKFDMNYTTYTLFLFIHALLHLKGHDHGATMEKAEKYFLKKYQLQP